MKWIVRMLGMLLVLSMLTGCGGGPAPQEETPAEPPTLNHEFIVLGEGETEQLSVQNAEGALKFVSDNPDVVTVDENGLVAFAGKGNARITVTVGTTTLSCGVIAGLDEALIDIRQSELEPLIREQYLAHVTVLRDFIVDDGEIYYIQRKDSVPGDLTIQHLDQDGNVDQWMSLIGFGGGVSISMDRGKDGRRYIWVESNGTPASEGQTLSRIPWESGTSYVRQGGQTWNFRQEEGAAYAAVDQENELVCIRTNSKAGYTFTYYNYADMIAGSAPVPLYQIELNMLTSTLPKDVNPSGASVGEYAFRGFAIQGQYIYQYFGTANGAILVAVYDMEGNAQYVHKVTQYGDLVFREPDGICIADGKMYIGITSGESADRRANIFRYS